MEEYNEEKQQQQVVVIQDVSREVNWTSIGWALQGLPLKPADKLTLLGILHQVNNPSTLSLMAAHKFLGYKSKVDSNSIFGLNSRIVNEEIARKKDEYFKNPEILNVAKKCEKAKIEFHVDVRAGASPKVVALKAARTFKATWVILDRQMKKDKKYFLERLSCRISRMKRDNTIELLRGPRARVVDVKSSNVRRSSTGGVRYDEMIPGSDEEPLSPSKSPAPQKAISGKEEQAGEDDGEHEQPPPLKNYPKSTSFSQSSSSEQLILTTTVSSSSLSNTEASTSSFTPRYPEEEYTTTTNTELETAGEQSSPFSMDENQEKSPIQMEYNLGNLKKQRNKDDEWMGGTEPNDVFKNSVCTSCNNRRPRIGWTRDFTYAELQAATEGFDAKNFLSEGGFGSVYRGELKKNSMKIAVKQHKNASFQGEKEFKAEVNVLSKARHENLVMLLGSCSEGSHRLLVYEYVCNGSLDVHLSKHSRRTLSWEKRMKIAMGAAQGLKYLHQNNIVHRDMRPNNILVTHDYESLLGDFGLARTQHEDSSDHSSESTRVVGSFGYLAPEYAESGKVSTKTDVYSFGVVLLQLITGLKTNDKILGGKSLVGWARPLLKERNYPDLIDQRIIDSHDVHQLFWMVRVAEKCLSKDPQKRLTMEDVVSALDCIIEGNTIGGIRDFSPAPAPAPAPPDSMSNSSENQSIFFSDKTSATTTTTTTSSSSSKSQIISPSPMAHLISSRKSSPHTSSTSYGKDYYEKKRELSRSRNNLLYDEMIN